MYSPFLFYLKNIFKNSLNPIKHKIEIATIHIAVIVNIGISILVVVVRD